jgi:carboxyl-terminal processing protease
MGPPPFAPIVAESKETLDATHPGAVRVTIRKAIFDAAWTAVLEKDFDRTLGGVDWKAEREKFEPMALRAPDDATFYRLLNQMLSGLGQSHLEVQGPGAQLDGESPETNPAQNEVVQIGTGIGDPGMTVRWIESQPTITQIRPESSAAHAGLRLGYLVTHIGGRPLQNPPPSSRALRPVEEKFRARRMATQRLSGPVGSHVTVRYLDEQDKPHEVVLTRDPPRRPAVQALLMPPLVPEVRTAHVGTVGIIAFNFFLLDPILVEVQKAIEAFRSSGMKTIILDLRGNPGGFGSMAIPIAAKFLAEPTPLGTIQFRDFANTLQVVPPLNHTPFLGTLIILTDEGTASTAEILTAGLQEAKRALVVGENTVGAALGSTIEELPGGAVIQIPVAGYKTPGGISLEGRGVKPDRLVFETRAAWLRGQDLVLETALAIAREKK